MQRNELPMLEHPPRGIAGSSLPAALHGRARGELPPGLAHILREVQRELGISSGEHRAVSECAELVQRVGQRAGFELQSFERDQILAYLEREQRPFGILQPLVDDPQVSDIIITDGSKIEIQQARCNISTDLAFPSQESYEAFVERLLQRCGTSYSTKKPIADGMLGSFARIHAVHRSLCESGPYVTIRLNRFATVSIQDLVKSGMAPEGVLGYLRAIVQCGNTLLIVGEVGTGKTTLSRALAGSIPAYESILVIEDTPEIRLEHPHVRYVRTREENSDGAGKISPGECIRAGMRMAMNRIIFGEIRDSEAAEAFVDVCASGHAGISTIHARSVAEATTRLALFLGRAQRGVDSCVLLEQIVTAVQVVIHVDICHVTGRRRIMEVREIGPVADGVIRQRDIFRYHYCAHGPLWRVLNRVSAYREQLERLSVPVVLSALAPQLELVGEQQHGASGLQNLAA